MTNRVLKSVTEIFRPSGIRETRSQKDTQKQEWDHGSWKSQERNTEKSPQPSRILLPGMTLSTSLKLSKILHITFASITKILDHVIKIIF